MSCFKAPLGCGSHAAAAVGLETSGTFLGHRSVTSKQSLKNLGTTNTHR